MASSLPSSGKWLNRSGSVWRSIANGRGGVSIFLRLGLSADSWVFICFFLRSFKVDKLFFFLGFVGVVDGNVEVALHSFARE